MTSLPPDPSVQALAWTLVHFLWQGAVLGVVVFVWLRVWRPSAQARYAGGIVGLAALLAAPIATFTWLAWDVPDRPGGPVALPSESAAGIVDVTRAPEPVAATLPPAPVLEVPGVRSEAADGAAVAIVTAWALGVVLLSLRLTGGWILARRLAARPAQPARADLCAAAATLSQRLGLTRAVRLLESTTVSVPMLVGWAKPIVLLPASALAGLSPGQIEALIAHELAHVRRHDYLVNLLQSIVETLLFYHPAVWLVSREVRAAREQCCDDLAIGVCDRVVYASALADLATMGGTPRIALAATGGSLLGRVRRILGHPGQDCAPGAVWLGVLSVALVIGLMPAVFGSAATREWPATHDARGGVADAAAVGSSDGTVNGVDRDVNGGAAVDPADPDKKPAGGVSDEGPAVSAGGDIGQRRAEAPRRPGEEAGPAMRTERDDLARPRAQDALQQREQSQGSPVDVRELAARLAAVEQQVAAARVQPAGGRVEAHSAAQLEVVLARARATHDAARADYERSRQQVDAGLLSSSAIREVQDRLAAAERELVNATAEAQVMAEETIARDTLDARRARVQSESRIRQAELELGAARERAMAIRLRFEVGTAPPETVAEAETRMAAAEQRLAAARAEFELAQEEIALRQRRTDALRQLVSEMQEQVARQALQSADEPIVADAAAQAQPGDILSIEIGGEPDLPRAYRIDQRGAIRLPLVGAIPVAGLTTQQVRDAVLAALKGRQLGEGRSVTVTLRRPR